VLAGCEQLGIQTPATVAATREADGRAIGAACRHSGRALEDCFAINKRASKAAIFSGWRDMDVYMRENNIEVVVPTGNLGGVQPAPLPATADSPGAAPTEAPPAADTQPDTGNAAPAANTPAGGGRTT